MYNEAVVTLCEWSKNNNLRGVQFFLLQLKNVKTSISSIWERYLVGSA